MNAVEVTKPVGREFSEILTTEALEFVTTLTRQFSQSRDDLMLRRARRQEELDAGVLPDFLPETEWVRKGDWKVWPSPGDLQDRRVEITGPSGDTKMVINAFNSGANVFMADFEDAQSPSWQETVQGQINVRDAIDRTIKFVSPEGKTYSLGERPSTLIVRPRGWHLDERHALVDGKPVPAALFDFGIFLFHNAKKLLRQGTGPYLYLPKLENRLEARLWNSVFEVSESELGMRRGTIKATVLIETILAAFEMDEILYELREQSSGLNCGRWDYIFSFIKKFRSNPNFVLPDRAQVTMEKAFLAAYVNLLIRTCHRRGAHAIGGMSAYIPVKNDERANRDAFEKVRADKEREATLGHDGTWVAHPGLVSLAREVFDRHMKGPNQLSVLREEPKITASDLLRVPEGAITEQGVRTNLSVGVQYIESWLRGKGAVPLYNLMEDAATAEICRAQLWQWIRHAAAASDGRKVTLELVRELMGDELGNLARQLGPERYRQGRFEDASKLFDEMLAADRFPEFLTTAAYEHLLQMEGSGGR